MYFLRRRHGRKPQSNRDNALPVLPVYAEPSAYAEIEEVVVPKPVVITKARRARVADTDASDCKPAGSFRAGTLHIAKAREADVRHR
ncbi:MAG: hypothetical protein ABI630_02005 [Betaproteobacteria bacterium]